MLKCTSELALQDIFSMTLEKTNPSLNAKVPISRQDECRRITWLFKGDGEEGYISGV